MLRTAGRFEADPSLLPQEQATRMPPAWALSARDGAVAADGARQGLTQIGSTENTYRAQTELGSSQSSQIDQQLRPLHIHYLKALQDYTMEQGHDLPGQAAVKALGATGPEDLARKIGMG